MHRLSSIIGLWLDWLFLRSIYFVNIHYFVTQGTDAECSSGESCFAKVNCPLAPKSLEKSNNLGSLTRSPVRGFQLGNHEKQIIGASIIICGVVSVRFMSPALLYDADLLQWNIYTIEHDCITSWQDTMVSKHTLFRNYQWVSLAYYFQLSELCCLLLISPIKKRAGNGMIVPNWLSQRTWISAKSQEWTSRFSN